VAAREVRFVGYLIGPRNSTAEGWSNGGKRGVGQPGTLNKYGGSGRVFTAIGRVLVIKGLIGHWLT